MPEDLRGSFRFARIQKSLRTSVERQAREAALDLDRLWGRRFAEASERNGIARHDRELPAFSTDCWTWPDWEALAAWFRASLAEEDWQARLSGITGHALSTDADLSRIPWRDEGVIRGELQFWLPLIACTHGMITSEILQLGPDTVLPHDEHPEILCFSVTNAGGRTTKTLARRRWLPIRHELLDLGFLDLVEQARSDGRRWLWPEMSDDGRTLARLSNYASTFFGDVLRKDLGVTEPELSLAAPATRRRSRKR